MAKTTQGGSLQPPLHLQKHSEEHKHLPPTELPLKQEYCSGHGVILLHLLCEVTLPVITAAICIWRDGCITSLD